jgi:hypothetical protein
MKIDFLYFDGCPSWQPALENLRTAIQEEHRDASLQFIQVTSDQEATDHHFLGSPSFQVNGVDFWPVHQEAFSLSCRVYPTSAGLAGWPTVAMLRQKLREFSGLREGPTP